MKPKIKILHIYKTYYPDTYGGIEKVIEELMDGCSQFGVESQLLCLTKNKQLIHDKISDQIVRSKVLIEISSNPFSFSAIKTYLTLVKNADIIHHHYPFPFGDLLCLLSFKKPVIVTYHSDIIKQKFLKYLYYPIQKVFFKNCDLIVCSTERYEKSSLSLRKYSYKTKVIHFGIKDRSYSLTNCTNKSSIKNGYFLFIGTFRDYKGLLNLINCARFIKEDIIILGNGHLKKNYLNIVKQENYTNVKIITDFSDEEKFEYIKNCICLILPSINRAEAFGIVLLEAAMFAKPMITTELGTGTSVINLDKVTGFVVKPNSTEDLVEKMNFLSANPDKASKMGGKARKRFLKKFSYDQMCKKYINLYYEIIKKNKFSKRGLF